MNVISRMKPDYGVEEREAILRVFDSGMFVKGPESKALEQEICEFTGAEACVSVNSGSTALMLVYYYLQQTHKQTLRIMTTPATYVATANVAKFLGQEVSFADIDIDSYCLSPLSVRDSKDDFDVLSLVHLYGNAADVELFQKFNPDKVIVEDCAQAFGTRIGSKHVGTTSFGCYSMFPTKNLSCAGDGGFILCQKDAYESLIRLRDNGRFFSMDVGIASGNFRLSEMQAAVAREQLKKVPNQIARRHEIALKYNDAFKDLPGVSIPKYADNVEPSWHLYCPLIMPQASLSRDKLILSLKELGIQSSSVYPDLVTDTEPFKDATKTSIHNSKFFQDCVISLPMHSGLTNEEVDTVIESIVRLLE